MVLLLVFMQLTRDLFAIAKFLFEVYEIHYYWFLPCCNFLNYLSYDKYLVVTRSPLP